MRKKFLAALLAGILLVSGAAVAQDGETSLEPVPESGAWYEGFQVVLGSGQVGLFLKPDKMADESMAIGTWFDALRYDVTLIEVPEDDGAFLTKLKIFGATLLNESDPSLGFDVYHVYSERTYAGLGLAVNLDEIGNVIITKVTGWVLSDELANSAGDAVKIRVGYTYNWDVTDVFEGAFDVGKGEGRIMATVGAAWQF